MDNKTTWELAYSQHKKYLTSLIFRMTGSLSEAEEIVQDAFVEFLNIDSKSINNSRSWLTKVCINKAINHMKSAYKQREFYPGLWLPDEIPESLGDWNKVHEENSEESRLILTESLTTSFLLLAENLSPEQRCVYILKEVFDYSFKDICSFIQKEDSTCRKIFQRAKESLSKLEKKFSPPPENARTKIMEFFEHVKAGNTTAIESFLSSSPELFGDGGGKVNAAGHIKGLDRVVMFMLHLGTSEVFNSSSYKIEYHKVNSRPGIVISKRLLDTKWIFDTILSFEFLDGRIERIYAQRNPDKLLTLLN